MEGEQKSLFLCWIMLSSEVNCTVWKRGGLGESGWDSLVASFYDPIKDVWLTSAYVEAGCALERLP